MTTISHSRGLGARSLDIVVSLVDVHTVTQRLSPGDNAPQPATDKPTFNADSTGESPSVFSVFSVFSVIVRNVGVVETILRPAWSSAPFGKG